jgi:hypothetical protein
VNITTLDASDTHTTGELADFLRKLIANKFQSTIMIWGPPGLGKSAIVASVVKEIDDQKKEGEAPFDFIDLRLGQLTPADLRGLPVPKEGVSKWYPPEFLPQDPESRGVLFLDEFNMAPPLMMSLAQQLILDRKVGSYLVPKGWYIWAAGNRRADGAVVSDMPSPVANRMIHYKTRVDFPTWFKYALAHDYHEYVTGFLSWRPQLLHILTMGSKTVKEAVSADDPAWPSPRTWELASQMLKMGLPNVRDAVGLAAAVELQGYIDLFEKIPDVEAILAGSSSPAFPDEPSERYAMASALAHHAKTEPEMANAMFYLIDKAPREFQSLTLFMIMQIANSSPEKQRVYSAFSFKISRDPKYVKILEMRRKDMAEDGAIKGGLPVPPPPVPKKK